MIRLCEACFQLLTNGQLDNIRPKNSRIPYVKGEECAFLHVQEADYRLRHIGNKNKNINSK